MPPRRILIVTAVDAERDAVIAGAAKAAGAHAVGAAAADTASAASPGGTPRAAGAAVQVVVLPDGRRLYRTGAFDVLAGGVGPAAAAAATATATALAVGAWGAEPHREGRGGLGEGTAPGYGLVVSAGIGGGFAGVAAVGSVVVASSIVAADLGVRTADSFTDVASLGFGRVAYEPPAALARAAGASAGAVLGPVLTVSTVTGTDERAAELAARHPGAAAEAMEGAGVAEAAAGFGVPVIEIRAVSNAVGTRDRDAWRIPDALAALTAALARITPLLLEGSDHG
jgi:futalosine hydrolase